MNIVLGEQNPGALRGRRRTAALVAMGIALMSAACWSATAVDADKVPPVKIAVFDFELEDSSAAASMTGRNTSSAAIMDKVSSEARSRLAQSGRYIVIDASKADAKPVLDKTVRDCGGCEAGIALQLGAEQSLVGIVNKVSMTDYYVTIRIRDSHTGKVIDQESANFAGGDDGWAAGVAMLIKHQVLAAP
jgi:opacity protein-like surface antigen